MDYEKEKRNQETELQNRLNVLKCEFESLREELKSANVEKEILNNNLKSAYLKIEFLKGQIEAYQYIVNCRGLRKDVKQ